ncbi:MAG TPA: hypothetical protein VGF23_22645 [Gaiellaceae bacterium]
MIATAAWVAVSRPWAQVWTLNPSALATRPVTRIAAHSEAPRGASSGSVASAATPRTTAQTDTWTSVS